MADLKVTRFIIDGKSFVIPSAASDQNGLMSSADFAKLAGIESGAQANVLEGVNVNGVALSIASKIVDILIAEGESNGTISVNGTEVGVKGLAALAFKANITAEELDAALQEVINAKAEQSALEALEGKIETLKGTGAGSISKAIDDAFNDFSTKVTDDEVVNSYKELIDWAAEHGGDAAEMAASISNLENLLAGIGGEDEPATVQAAIAAAVNALGIGNIYTKSETDALLEGKVNAVEGMGLSANDFSDALKSKLEAIEAGATANTYSYDAETETLTLNGFSEL